MPSLFYERLRDAIAVFRGQADAVVWRSKPPPSDKRLTCSCFDCILKRAWYQQDVDYHLFCLLPAQIRRAKTMSLIVRCFFNVKTGWSLTGKSCSKDSD